MKELEEWACSKEGCHAIQQYVSLSSHHTSPSVYPDEPDTLSPSE